MFVNLIFTMIVPAATMSRSLYPKLVGRQDQLSEALISKKRVAVLGNSHSAAVALAKLGDAWYTRCV